VLCLSSFLFRVLVGQVLVLVLVLVGPVLVNITAQSTEHTGTCYHATEKIMITLHRPWSSYTGCRSSSVSFKLAVILFTVFTHPSALCLHKILQVYTPLRNLWSSGQELFSVARTCTVLAASGFTHSAACIWNSLSVFIRDVETVSCFGRNLKTLCSLLLLLTNVTVSPCLQIGFVILIVIIKTSQWRKK